METIISNNEIITEIQREICQEILTIIENYNNFLIVTHNNPDGDAVGSVLALKLYLEKKGKKTTTILPSSPVDTFSFLPKFQDLIIFNGDSSIFNQEFEVVFILDLNIETRLKTIQNYVVNLNIKKILIDHHIENKFFTDIVLTDPEASSTGELIWKLITQDKNFEISQDIATALYTAILTDTGGFRFNNTNTNALFIASELTKYGAVPNRIYDKIYNTNSIKRYKLLGKALSSIESYQNDEIVILYLYEKDFKELDATEADAENFSDYLLTIKNSKVGLLFTENPDKNEVHISFRSKEGFSIRKLAMQYGGGGHNQAAGTRIKNKKIDDVKNEIIKQAIIFLENEKNQNSSIASFS